MLSKVRLANTLIKHSSGSCYPSISPLAVVSSSKHARTTRCRCATRRPRRGVLFDI
ncbi:hypothetical protein K523DRAFT_150728 [Schizophyllum commune Tattone D]|nr:hypothetical protein K523DRAFT_150728 [Schizophyllum commune Tattone D]